MSQQRTLEAQQQPDADVDARVTALRTQVEDNVTEGTRLTALTNARIARHEEDHTAHQGYHSFTLGSFAPSGEQTAGVVILGVVAFLILFGVGTQVKISGLFYATFAVIGVLVATVGYLWAVIQRIQAELARLADSHKKPQGQN